MKQEGMYIYLEKMNFFAHHGVLPQERVVGNTFTVDLKLKTNFEHAATNDDLDGTISYAAVYEAVKQEMKTPSKLLEHVCNRIVLRLFQDFPTIESLEIRLSKQNPPMGADIKCAGVEMHCTR